jgi:uncharacterized protein YgiM (DUF1202 family)
MRKTIIFLFAYFLCIVAVAQNSMYVSSSNGVNFRQGPGTNRQSLGTISSGEKIEVLSNDGEWTKVRYNGKTGYVSSNLLSEEPPKKSSGNKNSSNSNSGSSSGSSSNRNNSGSSSSRSSSGSYGNPNFGIGLRFGQPAGITAKKYNGNRAFELSIGHAPYWGHWYNYEHGFRSSKYSSHPSYSDIRYDGYRYRSAIGIQLHYLVHKDLLPSDLPGLKWYYGFGGQMRTLNLEYKYKYKFDGRDYWGYGNVTHFNLGIDGVLGLEYSFRDVPLSIFTDATLYIPLLNSPYFMLGQGGLGIRYNF